MKTRSWTTTFGACAALAACSGQAQKLEATSTGDLDVASPALSSSSEEFDSRCGSGDLTESGMSAIDRLPYLQQVTSTSASILFTLEPSGSDNPILHVSTPDESSIRQIAVPIDPGASNGRQRLARIDGLEPDTYYCYSLVDLTEPAGFRTAPLPSTEKPVRFIAFGDSGDGSAAQGLVRDQMETVPFDLILHTGDIAYGSGRLSSFESKFFDVYSDLLRNHAAFPTSGNHDYETSNGGPFRQVFALPENGGDRGLERWYSFDWGPVHFVALDTQYIPAEEIQWLEEDLSQNDLPWTIVYLHKSPFSSGDHGNNPRVKKAFVPLFERYGVQLVLAGHDHNYERTVPMDGVTYVITGGGGKGTRPVGKRWYTAFSEDVLHFVYGEVQGTELRLHAIDATGQRFDSVVIENPNAVGAAVDSAASDD